MRGLRETKGTHRTRGKLVGDMGRKKPTIVASDKEQVAEEPENIDNELVERVMRGLGLSELKERFKIKAENFKTSLDLQCYLIALQITATDKDFLAPITGKPQMGKSTLGIWMGIKTKEALRREFHVDVPEFDVEKDIYYPPISEKELMEAIEKKPPMMMFDRAIFEDATLLGMGLDASEIKDFKEGVVVYFSNMKTRKRGYNKFENDVKDVFQNSFIYDLIYTNPLMPEKNYTEFCDILIPFFDSALIVQCKECNSEDPERMIKRTVVNGLGQLKSSFNRAVAQSVKLFMVNSVKIFQEYDFANIKDIYPILIVNKKFPFFDYPFLQTLPEFEKLRFVPLIFSIDDLKFLLTELDTPSDLFAYFKKREEFIKNEGRPFQNERDLLSYYLLNGRSFEPKYVNTESGIIHGFYEEYKSGKLSDLFAKKKELDKISYWVDDVLKGIHLSAYDPNYLIAAEEVLKLDRVQRRKLAQRADEKRKKSFERKDDAWGLTIFESKPEVAFVVYFTPEVREGTAAFLQWLCITAQYKTNVRKVVGIGQVVKESDPHPEYNLESYFERREAVTLEEKEELEKSVNQLWGEGFQSQYGEFVE